MSTIHEQLKIGDDLAIHGWIRNSEGFPIFISRYKEGQGVWELLKIAETGFSHTGLDDFCIPGSIIDSGHVQLVKRLRGIMSQEINCEIRVWFREVAQVPLRHDGIDSSHGLVFRGFQYGSFERTGFDGFSPFLLS